MRKELAITLICLICGHVLFAVPYGKDEIRKTRTIQISSVDTVKGYEKFYAQTDQELNKMFADGIDSLVNSWYVKNAFLLDSIEVAEGDTIHETLPDSVYIQRLQAVDSYIDLSYNNTVKNFIAMYTIRKRKQVEVMLGLAGYYFPIFEEMLDKYNLPMELRCLPIIESALNPAIRSKANAVGLWQFMYGTGKMYKLEIDSYVDERCDPVKATEAAVRYLSDLYKIYGDWHLVIAAYNCGPGTINKAILRSGGKRNYWDVYYRLPQETRSYVPAFIAANYVVENYKLHNFQPHYPDFPIIADTIEVNQYLHFEQISKVLNIPVEQLRALNPQYRRDIIPARQDKPYTLKIPMDQVSAFIQHESEVYAYNRDTYFPNNTIAIPRDNYASVPGGNGKDKIVYAVRKGDNLGHIAKKFHVSIASLKSWNHVGNTLKIGQKITVYVPSGRGTQYASKGTSVVPGTDGTVVKQTSSHKAGPVVAGAEYEYYVVRKGDNLWTIARKYPGISNADLMQLNGIHKSENLKIGQKIKIRKVS